MAVADKTTVCSEKQNCILKSTNCEAFYAVVCAGKAKACLKVAVTAVENDFWSVWVCVAARISAARRLDEAPGPA